MPPWLTERSAKPLKLRFESSRNLSQGDAMKKIILIILIAIILALLVDACITYGHWLYVENLEINEYLQWLN